MEDIEDRLKYRLLIKFGSKENLEKLKNGNIYFNCVRNYRNDGTSFRGDELEGKYIIDPATMRMINKDGEDFFAKYRPYISRITESFVNDDDTLIFCASAITNRILTQRSDGTLVLCESFKREMKQFGDSAIILKDIDIIERIKSARDEKDRAIAFEAGMVSYRDKYDFNSKANNTGSPLDFLFDKHIDYINQNEWRIIIDGEFTRDTKGGVSLQTYPFEAAEVFPIEDLLNVQISITDGDEEKMI